MTLKMIRQAVREVKHVNPWLGGGGDDDKDKSPSRPAAPKSADDAATATFGAIVPAP